MFSFMQNFRVHHQACTPSVQYMYIFDNHFIDMYSVPIFYIMCMHTMFILTSTAEKRSEIKLIKFEVLTLHFVTM